MSKPKLTVCWITRQPHRYSLLENALTRAGFTISWQGPPDTRSDKDVQKWVTPQLNNTVHALLTDGTDLRWFSALKRLRSMLENSSSGFVPWIWVYDELHEPLVDRMVELGVDDFFPSKQRAQDLVFRIQLAIRRGQEKANLILQTQENVVRDAARETAVAQREEFLSICAHDLRSPIGLIQSSLSLVLNSHGDGLTSFIAELLNRAKGQAIHALRLVNDLLDVMSYEQGLKPDYEMIELHPFLEEFHNTFSLRADEKGIKFHYDNEVPDWRILGDSDRILQLLQNLFDNALKFTEPGKNIYLKVSAFRGRRKHDPTYPMLIISMIDEGRGIAEDRRKHIFDRFNQIKDYSKAEGRGLGLAVAKQISNLHSGNVWVTSEIGKGSKFNVLLPHVISRSKLGEGERLLKERKKKHILIAEPSENRRKEYYDKLKTWNYNITYVSDGVDAVVEAFYWLPDLIVLSPNLSRMAEEDVANVLKADPSTSHIGIVMAVRDKMMAEAKENKMLMDKVLTLPFTKATLSTVFKAIRKRQKSTSKKAA